MPTLYRKYRPQSFKDIVSQDHIVQTIKNEIAINKTAHAYLFSGPRGVGKTTLARLLAKAVNCENRQDGTFEPCKTCSSCQEITAGRNIDVLEIDAASHTGVENVRENIIESVQFKPTKSKYKVFIIDEIHMLSASSFNALLKTLEEPPAHIIFILATTELHKLPATIISRCQRFTFKKVPYEPMRERLEMICKEEKVKIDADVLDRVINKSDGCLRDAESLLGQILSLNLKKISAEDALLILPTSPVGITLEFLEAVLNNHPSAAIQLLQRLIEEGIHIDQFTHELIELVRTILILQVTNDTKNITTEYSEEMAKRVKKIAANTVSSALTKLMEALLQKRLQIKTSPLPQLPLELLIIEFTADISGTKENTIVEKESSASLPSEQKSVPETHRLSNSIKQAVAHVLHHVPNITLEQVQAAWSKVVEKIGAHNPSLTFILNMCQLTHIDHDGLRLSLPYSLHKEKLEEPKNRQAIEAALAELFSEKIRIVCEVTSTQETTNHDQDLDSLAVAFGGEIVN